MTPADLEALVDRLRGKRVLCVGDLVLDRFVYGTADRVSREAPVVALNERRREQFLGACGNVARNVAALGGAPILASTVGDDPEGHELSAVLAQSGVEDIEITVAAGRLTPVKTRYVAAGQQMLCVDRDPTGPIAVEVEDALIEAACASIPAADVVVVSDYARGAVTRRVLRAVINAARGAGRTVIADPRGVDFTRYAGANILKPNALELSTETGRPASSDAEVAEALAAVIERNPTIEHVLMTRGSKGMALQSRGAEKARFFRSEPRDVYDVSGAGDTTIAALALALAAGAPLVKAIRFANRVAGIVVTKIGTATVTAEEVIDDALGRTLKGAPVASLESAVEAAERWRAEGLRVGFTNGCFDLLHVGHLATLAGARSLCDRLIVGLNSDASVRRLKGEGRPVNAEGDRARMLAALGPVDLVTVFEEDTAVRCVEAIRPEIYVKGGDYTAETLPETPAVRAYGGEVVIAPVEPGRSTTATMAKIASG